MEGSAVFARFLKESSKDALCYKTAARTPSRYHIRMLIKAKHRCATPQSLSESYSRTWGSSVPAKHYSEDRRRYLCIHSVIYTNKQHLTAPCSVDDVIIIISNDSNG